MFIEIGVKFFTIMRFYLFRYCLVVLFIFHVSGILFTCTTRIWYAAGIVYIDDRILDCVVVECGINMQ